MRKGLFALALGTSLVAGAATAEAMPALDIPGSGPAPKLELVSGGCGIYAHRGPFGGCRPNFYGGYGYGYGRPHFGWRGGWHRGWRRW